MNLGRFVVSGLCIGSGIREIQPEVEKFNLELNKLQAASSKLDKD